MSKGFIKIEGTAQSPKAGSTAGFAGIQRTRPKQSNKTSTQARAPLFLTQITAITAFGDCAASSTLLTSKHEHSYWP
jgi:hypothetical protein